MNVMKFYFYNVYFFDKQTNSNISITVYPKLHVQLETNYSNYMYN